MRPAEKDKVGKEVRVVSILDGVVWEDLLEVVSEEERKQATWTSGERASGAEGRPSKNPPGRQAWSVGGTARRPMWLEQSKQGKGARSCRAS